jgi:hypothetical protein
MFFCFFFLWKDIFEIVAVFGLLGDHQDMHLLNLMIAGMLLMPFKLWMGKMVGEWSFHITLKVVGEVVLVVVAGVVEVRTWSAMSVVSLAILLENVVCVLAHEVWVVEGAGALLLGAAGAQAMIDMDAGVLVRVGDLPGAAAYHLLHVVEATAGLLHSAMLAVCHLMPMGTRAVKRQVE